MVCAANPPASVAKRDKLYRLVRTRTCGLKKARSDCVHPGAFETRMRPSETVALSWADIYTEARTIRINNSQTLNADNSHPKTNHSGRRITVSRRLLDLFVTLRHAWSGVTETVFEQARRGTQPDIVLTGLLGSHS